MSSSRIIIHIDFDYFFAQVEERENPNIKNKPVVVGVYSGRGEDSGAVSTANYVAREYGIRSGIPIKLAKNKLKNVEAVFLPVNHALYNAVSEKIMNIVRGYADIFEQVSVDEAFLEVTDRVNGSFQKARELAVEIKKNIYDKQEITCSIGIGPNKLVAKIAAGRHKPDGLTVVNTKEVKGFLSPLSVRELVGVGMKTEQILNNLGIKTIGELSTVNVDKLVNIFGSTLGLRLHNAALGIDESPVEEKGRAESVSRILTLKEDTRDLTDMMGQIEKLSEDVHSKVTNQRLYFKTISIIAVMNDFKMLTRSKTMPKPEKSLKIIKKVSLELLEQLLMNEPERLIRRLGVRLSGFINGNEQKKLIDF